MNYSNIDIELFNYLGSGAAAEFSVRVLDSPGGELTIEEAPKARFDGSLNELLDKLERRNLDYEGLVLLGTALADLLFPHAVRSLLLESLSRELALRIRIRTGVAELSRMPWEYVYLQERGETHGNGFLSLNRNISMVRYEPLHHPLPAFVPVGDTSLKVAALLANIDGDPAFPPLDLAAERSCLDPIARLARVHMDVYDRGRMEDLENALTSRLDVLHFAGHGVFADGAGSLILRDPQGQPFPLAAERLATNLIGTDIRLVVLSACETGRRGLVNRWTGLAPVLTRAGVPTVLGMQYRVRDRNAILFGERFYRALAAGQTVDAAVAAGRLAIFNRADSDRDWGVPVLYMRTLDDTVLFPQREIAGEGSNWNVLRGRAAAQSQRLSSASRAVPSEVLDRIYVRRTVEDRLTGALSADTGGFLLIGDSGMGKTTMLSQWARAMLNQGHAVFFYQCNSLTSEVIEEAIAADLGLQSVNDVVPALCRIAALPGADDKRLILIFDSLNTSRLAKPSDLILRINALVGHLTGAGTRVIVSCSRAIWRRLERMGVSDGLTWSCYFEGQPVLLEALTDAEAKEAYGKYQVEFHLRSEWASLRPELRARLDHPYLMSLLALTYKDKVLPGEITLLKICQKYFEERVQLLRDKEFADRVAAEMLRQNSVALPLRGEDIDVNLRGELGSDDPDSPYQSLLDTGVLNETEGSGFDPDTVQFSFIQIAGFLMAKKLYTDSKKQPTGAIVELVNRAHSFSYAWEVAKTLLLIPQNRYAILNRLAGDANPEVRELVVESVVQLQHDEPKEVRKWLELVLSQLGDEERRTALKVAYYIGPDSKDAFLWIATKGSSDLRRLARDTLYAAWQKGSAVRREGTLTVAYLLWNLDPDFTYSLLDDLLDRISWTAPLDYLDIVEFIARLSITIYINHCERENVIQRTAALYKRLADKLPLLTTNWLGDGVERLVFKVVAPGFARPILEAATLSDGIEGFFQRPIEERSRLGVLADFVDPKSDFSAARADLEFMLQSRVDAFNVASALVVGVHAVARFADSEALIRDLFERLDGHARVWLLGSFSVLIPDTPPHWIPLLESFTERLIRENRDAILGDHPLLRKVDILLAPLGLAYAKSEQPLSRIVNLIEDAGTRRDVPLLTRLVNGLGVLAIYYPQPVLAVLGSLCSNNPDIAPLLEKPLAMARALHLDEVDTFLAESGFDNETRRRIAASASIELVADYINLLGFYNNAVHFSVHYPRMREPLSKGAFKSLASASTSSEFLAEYGLAALHLFRDANFDLLEWTRQD